MFANIFNGAKLRKKMQITNLNYGIFNFKIAIYKFKYINYCLQIGSLQLKQPIMFKSYLAMQ